jgi:hypothetical protein
MAKKKALPYHLILEAMAFGFFFKTKNEQGEQTETDKLFLNSLHQEFEQTLASYCNFDPLNDRELIRELKEQYLKRLTSSTNKIL